MGFLSHTKAVVALLVILVFTNLAATEKKADTKKERRTRADEVEEITEEKGNGKEAKAGKEVKEEAEALDSAEKNEEEEDDDRVQEDKEETETGSTTDAEEEEIEDPEQEATEETEKAKEEGENKEINGERDERVRELTEEELEAVLNKNCSLVNLDDDEGGNSGSEVAAYPCNVALWFQGELPKWIKTFNFVKDVEALSRKELDEAAKAVCECKIIDISDFCSARVRVAAQKIIDGCPRNTIVTRIFRQAESHFGPHPDLYDVGKEEVPSGQIDLP
ncbi:uncharacterized protein LOC135208496 [Macrobrachium nipponense]|uniref:uncharacterized protein LOC135208496 n=1 Tax=Macrobrachium nipponense TaxID=159736 RepID=UPI0030C84ACD